MDIIIILLLIIIIILLIGPKNIIDFLWNIKEFIGLLILFFICGAALYLSNKVLIKMININELTYKINLND